jgi:(E)-4-hydroxy-3-methylbut-2-enyl-diphosphate synthase
MTPERLAALEAEQARKEAEEATVIRLDEEVSPTAGRRFTRA